MLREVMVWPCVSGNGEVGVGLCYNRVESPSGDRNWFNWMH